ncbi:MAG: hypothetical protein WAT39_01395 [Planctomycetota bacterium]
MTPRLSLLLALAPALSTSLVAQSNTVPGLNGRLSVVDELTFYGRRGAAFPNGEVGMAMLNEMCNPGSVVIPWQAAMQSNHPKFGFLITRVVGDRIEQINDWSFCKHAFVSTNYTGPCGPCQNPGTGSVMGINCADTYGSGNNADRFWLGPPVEIDPWLGTWGPVGSYFDIGDPAQAGYPAPADGVRSLNQNVFASDPVKNRVTVREQDLLTPGAQYFYGIHLIHQGEAVANRGDNLASRGFNPVGSGGSWSFANNAVAQAYGSILTRWPGAQVNSGLNGNDDGRFFVASKVTPIGGGMYRYEYAIHNADNNRGGASFRVPLAAGATVQNAGFRDIDQNPLNNWTFANTGSEIAFTAVGTNALNWNTIYNCWFDCSVPAGAGNMTIDEARTGPGALSVVIPSQVPSGQLFAGKTSVGTACGTCTGTFYQLFAASSAFDLAGRSMTMSLGNGAYTVSETPVAYQPLAGTNLALGLSGQAVVTLPFALPWPGGTTTQLQVSSSGFVSPGANPVQLAPSVSLLLAGQPRWAGLWGILNPATTSANNVYYDANPARAIVTWNNVPFLAGTAPNNFQMQFFPDGTVHVLWQTVAASSFPVMAGWSTGGGFSDPGPRDLSAALPATFSLCAAPFDGLVLDTSAQPVLGTTLQWQLTRIPAATGWGALMRSLTQAVPPVDLTAAGMPGCFAHVVAPVATLLVSPGASAQVPEVLPNVPALMGLTLVGQAVTYNPGLTPLGLVASNGIVLLLGF